MSNEPEKTLNLAETGTRGRESNRRLFIQFMAFGGCPDPAPMAQAMEAAEIPGAVYADLHDPFGVGLVTLSEDPEHFLGPWRKLLTREPFAQLTPKPRFTMFGRTYTLGYEPDLEDTLVHRPTRTTLHPEWQWVVWYPVRRSGAFALLPEAEQKSHLKEHGQIGMQYGRADYAHDIRLSCHGIDREDNDFVVGLTGKELAPLSKLVEHMRQTQQTARYLDSLGPFFVGRSVWKSPIPAESAR